MNTKRKTMARADLALELEQLAAQIRSGAILTDSGRWQVPDQLDAKLAVKEKKGRFECKLALRWSTLNDYSAVDRDAIDRWQRSFKTVKKQLASAFKPVVKSLDAGQMPDPAALAALVEHSRRMTEHGADEWAEALSAYNGHLRNLVHAVETGQTTVARHEIKDLGNCMRSCHREFK